MDDTVTATLTPGRAVQTRSVGALFLAHHPRAELVGRVRVFEEPLVLGRRGAAWPEVLDDPHLSRNHAEFAVHKGVITVRDLDSRNGTLVDGAAIRQRRLRPGEVVRIGSLLLVARPVPEDFTPIGDERMLGIGPAMAAVRQQLDQVGSRGTSVLLLGEPGVGKEVVARELHRRSGRAGPFVAVDCGAVADGVLQSELFGHHRGAYSGAGSARRGLVRGAEGGTLFLDEIGNATASLQQALLRLLQEGEMRPVGADRSVQVDVRCVAATNANLTAMVAAGSFRQDLLDRLSRWVIEIPPLRDRIEDLPVLARHFARRHAARDLPPTAELSAALLGASWPGNVRQLDAVIERAVITAGQGSAMDLDDALCTQLAAFDAVSSPTPEPVAADEPVPVSRPTGQELQQMLLDARCKVTPLARSLGVGRSTLYRWIEELEIDLVELRKRL